MTNSDDYKKAREFWIIADRAICEFSDDAIWDIDPGYNFVTHVIEYSAYEKLKAECDELKEFIDRIRKTIKTDAMAEAIFNLSEERDQLKGEMEIAQDQIDYYKRGEREWQKNALELESNVERLRADLALALSALDNVCNDDLLNYKKEIDLIHRIRAKLSDTGDSV